MRLVLLELFSGRQTVSRIGSRILNCECVSIDICSLHNPTIATDILTITDEDLQRLADSFPDVDWIIWASPPCQHYSRVRTRVARDLDSADNLVKAAWKFIDILKPVRYFIENPASGLLSGRAVMSRAPLPPFQARISSNLLAYSHRGSIDLDV